MDLLKIGASQLDLYLSEDQLDQFETYSQELADWNKRANLTAIIEYEATQIKHFLDSLTVCLTARDILTGSAQAPTRVIDVGAGAGLPGLALKIVFPEIELALLESVAKKTAFMNHMVEKLGLDGVTVHNGRSEYLARDKDLRDSFDLVVVRALQDRRKAGGAEARRRLVGTGIRRQRPERAERPHRKGLDRVG